MRTVHNVQAIERNVIGYGMNIWNGSTVADDRPVSSGFLVYCPICVARIAEIACNVFLKQGTIDYRRLPAVEILPGHGKDMSN